MLLRAPCIHLFFLAIYCWVKHNDAISLATFSSAASQTAIQDIFQEENKGPGNNWNNTSVHSYVKRQTDFDSHSEEVIKNSNSNSQKDKVRTNYNQNVNVLSSTNKKSYNNRYTSTTTLTPLSEYNSLEDIKEEQTNCTSYKKKNQRYTSSFIGNTTGNLSVDKQFDRVFKNNSKVKIISSVHESEDITLCWIETTTIKENRTVRPSKKLVIREYTISFEDSATIPDRYLECKRFEGELAANDSEIGKTTLFEIIDEDTKVSKVVNFTSVSHVGDIVVWQHKRVKCGVGPIITKKIIEWNDGKNPKKRMEIKVSPKMQVTKTGDFTEKGDKVKSDSAANITESCENTETSSYEVTTTTDGVSTEVNTTEMTVAELTSGESEKKISLSSDGAIDTTSTSALSSKEAKSTAETFVTTSEKLDCEEDSLDPACIIQELTTPSSPKKLSVELSITTQATAKSEVSASSISTKMPKISTLIHKNKTTEKKSSSENIPFMEPSSESSEKISKTTLDLATERITILPTKIIHTGTSVESSKTHAITSKDETKIATSRNVTKSNETTPMPEKVSSSFVESKSNELDNIDYVTAAGGSTISSSKIGTEQGATATPLFTEFTNEFKTLDEILDKISEPPSLTENTTATFEERGEGEKTTIGLKITSEKEIITETRRTSPGVKPVTLSPTTSGKIDYSCENFEDCSYASSSESCKFGNCDNTTSKSCESETCSSEEEIIEKSTLDTSTPPEITTTKTQPLSAKPTEIGSQRTVAASATTISSQEEKKYFIDKSFTITENRRSTTATLQHELTLKVKVLLEHINEKKEKHNLIEVERQLALQEDPYHKHSDLIKQLKSLNSTVNVEAVSALLNYTILSNLRNASFIINNNLKDLESSKASSEDLILIEKGTSDQIKDKYEDLQSFENKQEREAEPQKRRRRSLKEIFGDKTGDLNRLEAAGQSLWDFEKNVQFSTMKPTMRISQNEDGIFPRKKDTSDGEIKIKVARQTLPGIREDVSNGLQHMIVRLTKKTNDMEKMPCIDLLDVIADPNDNRIHSRRRRRAAMEKVGHWSNERISEAPMGGSLRSFTEFILYKILP